MMAKKLYWTQNEIEVIVTNPALSVMLWQSVSQNDLRTAFKWNGKDHTHFKQARTLFPYPSRYHAL
jgi:hypothetical protein